MTVEMRIEALIQAHKGLDFNISALEDALSQACSAAGDVRALIRAAKEEAGECGVLECREKRAPDRDSCEEHRGRLQTTPTVLTQTPSAGGIRGGSPVREATGKGTN